MTDDWKGKAVGYLKGVGKKKDELVEKVGVLKDKYDETQRKKMEGWVYKKEAELQELEKTLEKREKIIKQRELKLKQQFFVRFVGVAARLSIIGLFMYVVFVLTTEIGIQNSINKESRIAIDTSNKSHEYRLSIPSDSGASYYVIKKEGSKDMPILITKRIGSSGTTYAKRIFDCQNKTTKYLGDGDSIAAMNRSSPSPRMGGIILQSIAWYQWNHVCNN